MGLISKVYDRLTIGHPKVEVAIRSFYWNHVGTLMKFKGESSVSGKIVSSDKIDFDKIMSFIRSTGIKDEDILLIHSSYESLKPSGLDASQIIDNLKSLVSKGTLAMPAIRHFKEEGEGREYLLNYMNDGHNDVVTKYDIYRTPITSGLLPFTLMRYDDAVISEFPLNPIVAIGKDAEAMVDHNLEGKYPSAHGPMSSWAYCMDKNAWNIGLGVDIKDFLTIFHVFQECDDWPVEDWYFKRKFIIKQGKKEKEIEIKERKHKWTKFFAEKNFYRDLENAGILKKQIIDGVLVCAVHSHNLRNFIKSQKLKTYPYYI